MRYSEDADERRLAQVSGVHHSLRREPANASFIGAAVLIARDRWRSQTIVNLVRPEPLEAV
jgi:hypothetical protein